MVVAQEPQLVVQEPQGPPIRVVAAVVVIVSQHSQVLPVVQELYILSILLRQQVREHMHLEPILITLPVQLQQLFLISLHI
jgi:hypothetical protein